MDMMANSPIGEGKKKGGLAAAPFLSDTLLVSPHANRLAWKRLYQCPPATAPAPRNQT
jgi:hypothetical protein